MNRKCIFVMGLILLVHCNSLLFAAGTANNIELPDVITIIDGDSIKAGLEALSETENPIVMEKGSGTVVPEFVEEEEKAENTEPEFEAQAAEKAENPAKPVYGNGLVGGGYPAFFKGDFSLSAVDEINPFKLAFSHDSALGYAGHSLTDGYNDRKTQFSVSKNFCREKYEWGFGGSYQSVSNGLQNHIEGISSLNQDVYAGKADFVYKTQNGIKLGVDGGANFYNRYADVTKGDFPVVSFLTLVPQVFIRWEDNGISAGFTANYTFGRDYAKTFEELLHRGKFKLDFSWQNDYVKLYAAAAAIVGNHINGNSVVVPFAVGVNAAVPVSFSTRALNISAEGGIDSKLPKLYEVENLYRFTISSQLAQEQSDWYGKLSAFIPFGQNFTGGIAFEYRQTAFDNGVFTPVYLPVKSTCYDYLTIDTKQFNTVLSLAYKLNCFTFQGAWEAYWLDVPVLKNENTVCVHLIYNEEQKKWGADFSVCLLLNEEIETPEVNLEAYVKMTSAVDAVLQVNDAVKLFKAEERIYAGSYLARGGSAALLLKFAF